MGKIEDAIEDAKNSPWPCFGKIHTAYGVGECDSKCDTAKTCVIAALKEWPGRESPPPKSSGRVH